MEVFVVFAVVIGFWILLFGGSWLWQDHIQPYFFSKNRVLRGSIRKWYKIATGRGLDKGPSNCPLCLLYRKRSIGSFGEERWSSCSLACPVLIKTGRLNCLGSPYEDFHKAIESNPTLHDGRFHPLTPDSPLDIKTAAWAEYAFLKGLKR